MLAVMGPANMKGLYMGSRFNDGRLFRHGDPVYLDATNTPYDCVVETKEFDFDAPEYVKRSFWVSFEKGGQGVSNIANVFDSVQQPVAPLTYSDSNRRALRVLAAVFFRVWRVRVTSTQDGPQTLYGFMLAASQKKKALASV
jgi:hypothetical protein